jgi:hypothetical protein
VTARVQAPDAPLEIASFLEARHELLEAPDQPAMRFARLDLPYGVGEFFKELAQFVVGHPGCLLLHPLWVVTL